MKKLHEFREVQDGQKMYRILLEAFANPTRELNIRPYADKLFGTASGFLAVAMTLLDNEVTFHTCENQQLSNDLIMLTLSRREELAQADYVFVQEAADLEKVLANVKCGTLQDPQKSATLIIRDCGVKDQKLRLIGPGILGTMEVMVSPIVAAALRLRDDQCYEYPQGVDMIFVSEEGTVAVLPRLVRKEVL